MKFYSEITKELYDSVDALNAAEKIEENKKHEKVMELIDDLTDAQLEVVEIAGEIAKLTGKDFEVSGLIVNPQGDLSVISKDGTYGTVKADGTVVPGEVAKTHPADCKCGCHDGAASFEVKNAKIDLKALEDIFGIPTGKVAPKANPIVLDGHKDKKLTDKEFMSLLEALTSL